MSRNHDLIAGVGPKGLCEDYEVKILICYLMSKINKNLNIEELKEVLIFSGLVNHFVFVQALNELLSLEHIKDNGNEEYSLTEKGIEMAQFFSDSISESVREKAVECAQNLIKEKDYDEQQLAYIEELEVGYNICLNLGDNDGHLMELKLFAPDKKQCEIIKNNFYENPELIYKVILNLLTGDINCVYTSLAQRMLKFPNRDRNIKQNK